MYTRVYFRTFRTHSLNSQNSQNSSNRYVCVDQMNVFQECVCVVRYNLYPHTHECESDVIEKHNQVYSFICFQNFLPMVTVRTLVLFKKKFLDIPKFQNLVLNEQQNLFLMRTCSSYEMLRSHFSQSQPISNFRAAN